MPTLRRVARSLGHLAYPRYVRVYSAVKSRRSRFATFYDVEVFLKELPDRWPEPHCLADLRVRLIDDTGAFFDVLPYPAGAYAERSPLMREIRREGLEIWAEMRGA